MRLKYPRKPERPGRYERARRQHLVLGLRTQPKPWTMPRIAKRVGVSLTTVFQDIELLKKSVGKPTLRLLTRTRMVKRKAENLQALAKLEGRMPKTEIAKRLGVSRQQVYTYLQTLERKKKR